MGILQAAAFARCRAGNVIAFMLHCRAMVTTLILLGLLATSANSEKYKLTDRDMRTELGLAQPFEKDEIRDVAAKAFKQIDHDDDGGLSLEEFKAYPETQIFKEIISNGVVKTMHHQTAFAHADDDFNLSISPSEFVEYAHNTLASAENIEHNWRYADKDKNGVLTRDEYQSALGGDDEDGAEEFMQIGRGKDVITEDDFIRYHSPDDFGASDLNGDGVLDLKEWRIATFHGPTSHIDEAGLGSLDEDFKDYDVDKDGLLSSDEFNSHHHEAARLPNEFQSEIDGMKIEDFDLDDDSIQKHMKGASGEMLDDL